VKSTSGTDNRKNLASTISLANYDSLQETDYLLRSAANAKRLLNAVGALKRTKGGKRKLKPSA